MKVVKKDNTKEPFNVQKVVIAVNKSAFRALVKFTDEEIDFICRFVQDEARKMGKEEIEISEMHNIVEGALERVNPKVAKSYRDYRNYKQDFVQMLDEVYKKSQSIMYIGDKENSNTDSALVSTKRSLIFNQLNKELYKKFFLTTEELQACRDGYIYIHDMSARRDTMNCCLFDVQSVLQGGFEMGNLWYNEPKTLDVAFDVIGDIVLSAASQQYGGFTVPSADLILEPYAEKSYKYYIEKYKNIGLDEEKSKEIIESYKKSGKKKKIEKELKKLKESLKIESKIPKDLCYVQGQDLDDYLHDMDIVQRYASKNRELMAEKIVEFIGLDYESLNKFESIHNYIEVDKYMLRKGAISAYEGEDVLIPINMRDGVIIGKGKGNPNWNYSAPHGAGRILSRAEAKNKIHMNDYKASMKDIFTTCVNVSTLDEAPQAYKPIEEIINNITDTVDIKKIIKPIYNFKSN